MSINQNITLSIPKDVLLKVKVLAAKEGISISGLMTRALQQLVAQDEGYRQAMQAHQNILAEDLTLGTNGAIAHSRESLHER